MSNPIVTFNLGSDAKVDIEIRQSYKMKIRPARNIHFIDGKPYLLFIINYYTNGVKIPLLTQPGGFICLGYEEKWGDYFIDITNKNKLRHLRRFIYRFKKNKSVKSKLWSSQCAWVPKNNTWRVGRVRNNGKYVGSISSFPLCDDSKEQFVEELQRLLYLIENIYIKGKYLHPAIMNINLINYTYH